MTLASPCERCGREPRLAGIYELQRELGRGASGVTFAAVDAQTGETCAVKEVPLGRVSSTKALELIEREARILQELSHPSIPRFIASMLAGEGRSRAIVLAQELVPGEDLQTEMAKHRYNVREVLDIADELLDVLVYLHDLSPPVIHRDLKPKNIMRRPDGRLVLLDFGAARETLKELDFGGSTVAGTFGYMAPEQLIGCASAMSDLYSLGALLVQLLSRTDPQRMLSASGLDWEGRVSVPAGVRDLLKDLLESDPDVRRQKLVSTEAVRRRVQQLKISPEGPQRLPATRASSAVARVERTSLAPVELWVAAGGATLLLLSLVAFGIARERPRNQPRVELVPIDPVEISAVEPVEPVEITAVEPVEPVEITAVEPGNLLLFGAPGAPVTIVAFSDYQCPFCMRAMQTLEELVEKREGTVAVYWRDFPLAFHTHARQAAAAGRCAAAQGRLWEVDDALFEAARERDDAQIRSVLAQTSADLGAFERCLSAPSTAAAIESDVAYGTRLGVNATPTFFISGERISGAMPLERFEEAVDRALERKRP